MIKWRRSTNPAIAGGCHTANIGAWQKILKVWRKKDGGRGHRERGGGRVRGGGGGSKISSKN